MMRAGSIFILIGLVGCSGAPAEPRPSDAERVTSALASPATPEPPNTLASAGAPGERPPLQPGAAKPWEGGVVSTGAEWTVHPGGNLQNRVRLARWSSPAVGPDIEVTLVHDSSAATLSRASGKGFHLAVGALLAVRSDDGKVVIEEPDGTQRTFTRRADGGFDGEVFDTAELSVSDDQSSYTLKSGKELKRVFKLGKRGIGREVRRVDRTGDAVTIAYDKDDYPTSIADSAGRTATFTRGAAGRYETITDPEGRAVRLVYDGDDLAQIVAPAVAAGTPSLRLRYDAAHRLVARSAWGNANGTEFTYDDAGLVAHVTTPERITGYSFSWTPASIRVDDGLGHTAESSYQGGALVQIVDARGQTTKIEVDALRRTMRTVDPRGRARAFTYNDAHDVTSVTDELGRTTKMAYEAHLPTEITDPTGGVTSFKYGPKRAVRLITNPLGEKTYYQRDGDGNLIEIRDFTKRVRMSATYDTRGHALTVTNAGGLVTRYTYDELGALREVIDPLGRVTRTSSSPMGRPLEVSNGFGEVASFAYDPLGRLARATNPRGDLSFAYDLDGRITQMVDSTAPVVRQVDATSTPDGRVGSRRVNGIALQAAPQGIAGLP